MQRGSGRPRPRAQVVGEGGLLKEDGVHRLDSDGLRGLCEVWIAACIDRKLVLEVRPSAFGEYGYCNLCVNGTDHNGNNSCTNGHYDCRCCPKGNAEAPGSTP